MATTVTYRGPHAAVEIVEADLVVERGDSVEVPDELAERLLQQEDAWSAGDRDDTVKAVKARVGDDAEVARAELAIEQTREHPRISLVKHLEGVIEVADANQPPPAEPTTFTVDTVTEPGQEV